MNSKGYLRVIVAVVAGGFLLVGVVVLYIIYAKNSNVPTEVGMRKERLDIRTALLATMPERYTKPVFSQDKTRATFIREKENGKVALVVNGKEEVEYDYIYPESLQFTADSKNVAFIATKGDKSFAVVGKKEGKNFPKDFFSANTAILATSQDGSKYAFKIREGQKSAMVINDEIRKYYQYIQEPYINPDGTQIAYRAGDQDGFVVLNDKEGKKYERSIATRLLFSPDGRRLMYLAAVPKNERGFVNKGILVVDGKEQGVSYEGVQDHLFSPDSRHFAYVATKNAKQLVVVDEKPGKEFEGVALKGFLDDGRVVYIGRRGEIFFLVIGEDAKEFPAGAFAAHMNQSGDQSIYLAPPEGKVHRVQVIDQGKRWPGIYDLIVLPQFDEEGKHVAVVASQHEQVFVVVDGHEGGKYDKILGEPIFSPEGEYIIYNAQREKDIWLVVDKIEDLLQKSLPQPKDEIPTISSIETAFIPLEDLPRAVMPIGIPTGDDYYYRATINGTTGLGTVGCVDNRTSLDHLVENHKLVNELLLEKKDIPAAIRVLGRRVKIISYEVNGHATALTETTRVLGGLLVGYETYETRPSYVTNPLTTFAALRTKIQSYPISNKQKASFVSTLDLAKDAWQDNDRVRMLQQLGVLSEEVTTVVTTEASGFTSAQAFEIIQDMIGIVIYFDPAALIAKFKSGLEANDINQAVEAFISGKQSEMQRELMASKPEEVQQFANNLTTQLTLSSYKGDYDWYKVNIRGGYPASILFTSDCDGIMRIGQL